MSQDNSLPIHAANGTIDRIESLSNVPPAARLVIVLGDGTERTETFESRDRQHPGKYLKDEYVGFRVFTDSIYNQAENTLRVNVREITNNDWRYIIVTYPDGDSVRIDRLDGFYIPVINPRPIHYVEQLERNDYTLCEFVFNPRTRDFEVELGPGSVTLAFQLDNGNDEARETFGGDKCNYEDEIEEMYGDEYDIYVDEYDDDDGHSVRVELTELTPREQRERRARRARAEAAARERLALEAAAREQSLKRNLPKLKVPRNNNNNAAAENTITANAIANGNMMANFHGEYEQGRYYKKRSVNTIMSGRNNQKKNPYTRVPLAAENITYYVAKVNNVPANNTVAGGTRRRKRKNRKTRRRR